jgi:serine/threonine-protein kinase
VVALKVLKQGMGVNKDYLERFKREQEAAGALNHPNIVATVDCGLVKGVQFIAMEYVEGENVRARIERDGKIPEKEALRIAANIARALQHAHNHGWVHRDVKPENMLTGLGGSVKLADLGLAKSVFGDSGLTHTGQVVGTPYYIAPEQARGDKTLDPRTDQYSLGCSLYHMLTGKVPFEAPSPMDVLMLHIQGSLTNPADLAPELTPNCVKIVTKMLAKEIVERYPTTDAVIEDLERVHRGENPANAEMDLSRSSILPPDPNRFKKMVIEKHTAAGLPPPKSKGGCLGVLLLIVALIAGIWTR